MRLAHLVANVANLWQAIIRADELCARREFGALCQQLGDVGYALSIFSYFSGFESILYALVMGHLLLGVGRTISIIERVQLSWVHVLIVTQILLTLSLSYYYSFFIQDLYVKTAETSKWLWFFTRILPVGVSPAQVEVLAVLITYGLSALGEGLR